MEIINISAAVNTIIGPDAPNRFMPMTVRLTLRGFLEKSCNAMRRVLLEEYPVRVLKLVSVECADISVKPEVVEYHLSAIKIDQSIPDDVEFVAIVDGIKPPMTSDLTTTNKEVQKKMPICNSNIAIIDQVEVHGGTWTKLICRTATYYKYIPEQGSCGLVNMIRYVPSYIDTKSGKEVEYDKDALEKGEIRQGDVELTLDMTNNIGPAELLTGAVDIIITRLKMSAQQCEPTLLGRNKELSKYEIVYPAETNTLGNLIYDAVYLHNPLIPMITFEYKNKLLYINITTRDSVEELKADYRTALEKYIVKWEKIREKLPSTVKMVGAGTIM
jgi:hypothetical protein